MVYTSLGIDTVDIWIYLPTSTFNYQRHAQRLLQGLLCVVVLSVSFSSLP